MIDFKILKPEQFKALDETQQKKYLEKRIALKNKEPEGYYVKYFCRQFIENKEGEIIFDLLAETGKDYELKIIKEDFYGWVGDANYIKYYKIGNTQQVYIHHYRSFGIHGYEYYHSFTTMQELHRKAVEKAERERFKLPIKSTLGFNTYSYKNPKEWDGKLDPILDYVQSHAENAPHILFFKNKAQYFCATAFEIRRKIHQGHNNWLAVSTFTPHGDFTPKPKGGLMLFSKYCGEEHYIPNIYKGNVERIDIKEFANALGVSEGDCIRENLFPSWY